jgi:hypothetical protein
MTAAATGFIIALAAVPCLNGFHAYASQQSSRVVGTMGGRDVVLYTPANYSRGIEHLVILASSAAGVPAGVEVVEDEPLGERIVNKVKNPQRTQITGRPLRDVLDLIISVVPPLVSAQPTDGYKFAWSESGGVIHVSPLVGRATFLDRTVAEFNADGLTFDQLLTALHRTQDPNHPEPKPNPVKTGGFGANSLPRSERPEQFQGRFTLTRHNIRLRDLLDAIVIEHGGLSWAVRYRTPQGAYSGSAIWFHSFHGAGYGRLAAK